VLLGPPPRVVWIRLGNCSTGQVAELLRARSSELTEFADQEESAFLELG
jgi:predicted nuclease of predicted toxin-antitoxin system